MLSLCLFAHFTVLLRSFPVSRAPVPCEFFGLSDVESQALNTLFRSVVGIDEPVVPLDLTVLREMLSGSLEVKARALPVMPVPGLLVG